MQIRVLSLKSAVKRREYMALKLAGLSFSFFDALSPKDLDDRLFKNLPEGLSKEAVATFESHRKLISSCNGEPLVVLEDDATPTIENFLQSLENLIAIDVPWDIMMLGYNPLPGFGSYSHDVSQEFKKINLFIGMHAYVINPNGVSKILSELGEPNNHIDYRISNLVRNNRITGIFSKKKLFKQNNKEFPTQIPKRRDLKK